MWWSKNEKVLNGLVKFQAPLLRLQRCSDIWLSAIRHSFELVPITTTTAQNSDVVLQLWFNFTRPARQPTSGVSQLDLCCSLVHPGQLASQSWKQINPLFILILSFLIDVKVCLSVLIMLIRSEDIRVLGNSRQRFCFYDWEGSFLCFKQL